MKLLGLTKKFSRLKFPSGNFERGMASGRSGLASHNCGVFFGYFIFFLYKSYEERSLSLLSFFFNNLIVFYVLRVPDPYIFLVSLFISEQG